MTLAPYSRRRHEEEACEADAEEVVAGEKRDGGEWFTEGEDQAQGVGGEERREGRRENGEETQDAGDEVAAPERPVEGIIGVIAGLRNEDDWMWTARPLERRVVAGGEVGSLQDLVECRSACRVDFVSGSALGLYVIKMWTNAWSDPPGTCAPLRVCKIPRPILMESRTVAMRGVE